MKHVLITLSGGIIDRVTFCDDPSAAVRELARFVKNMDPEKDDAAVYGPDGLIANAKALMDQDSQFPRVNRKAIDVPSENKSVYVMANSDHRLGFLVVGPCEPLGYVDALAALSSLERMRKELGTHINLYRLALVMWSIVSREELEKYNAGHSVSDFEYSLVSDFLR
jgi:hypothetical protein